MTNFGNKSSVSTINNIKVALLERKNEKMKMLAILLEIVRNYKTRKQNTQLKKKWTPVEYKSGNEYWKHQDGQRKSRMATNAEHTTQRLK